MTVRLHENSTSVKIDVRQGDTLFIAVLKHAFKSLDWDNKGLTIDGAPSLSSLH